MVKAEQGERVLDGVTAFDTEEDREFIQGAGDEDFVRRGAEGEVAGVAVDLLEDAVEEGEGAVGVAVVPLGGFGPEGEEGAGEVALAGGGEGERWPSPGGW